MSLNFLDFEQPIAELEAKIDSLTAVSRQDEKLDINIDEEVHRLREKSVELTRKIFADLGAWQVAQLARLARHPQRPYTNWRAIRSVRTPWIMSVWRLMSLMSWRAIAPMLMTKPS
ncbi:Acetyl-coenzyme A carboxyl transferase alpha chain [Salmonella enterica subsp. enterica serovar Uganda str. R8-3404]|uniref:Acetyl-coenzyme A carboxyl transferase alpha chain n=1 Tax=Salmonella enterica subsp. enterica serovar Uganda str. R8-3404 TaxID=913083 RepID=A0A6C8H839_SALET|nr:Acetyl-coenzyme A carboxyl transferase alpha chain [Salmonella enterica subsp. enterica serovar Uganda str. R8-3404]